jgi:gamma-glutamyltranspeptidase/glutathione hydrolase
MNLLRDFAPPGRSVAVASTAMAATSHPAATLAALDVLRAGGNAIDAAIAAVALQGVVDPHMTGIGGDCFVIYAPAGKAPIAYNGSGRAAARLTLEGLRAKGIAGAVLPDESVHAVTIPGAVEAWARLSQDHGKVGLDVSLEPAIRAAREGFVIAPRVAWDISRTAGRLKAHLNGSASPYLPGGEAPGVGAKLTLPALAATLETIARKGRAGFYEGEVAASMVARLKGLGGFHEAEDFASHRGDYVEPISADYRGYTLHECPPNGQGLTALVIAKILEGFPLDGKELTAADRVHLLAEATKAAYRLRDRVVADPAHVAVDVAGVLSDANIAAMRAPITLGKALPAETWDGPVHKDTVYVTVVDRDGNACSFINSIFHAFGSGIVCGETGVVFQNRGCGFRLIEGHANCIAGGKRPLHTIIPAMLTKDGRAVLSYGVMGGQYQATGHAHVLSRIVDCGDNPQAASDYPRSFVTPDGLTLEPALFDCVGGDLARRGHRVIPVDEPIGGCQAIWIDHERGVLLGGSDHRKDGMALGY